MKKHKHYIVLEKRTKPGWKGVIEPLMLASGTHRLVKICKASYQAQNELIRLRQAHSA